MREEMKDNSAVDWLSMDGDTLFDWFLTQDPLRVHDWLARVVDGSSSIAPEFNWLVFAQTTAAKVLPRAGGTDQSRLAWAKVAILVYRFILQEAKEHGRFVTSRRSVASKEHGRFSFELSLMTVKANCLLFFGNIPGDPVLDGNDFVLWFFDNLPYNTPEEALQKIRLGREHANITDVWKFSRITQKLRLIKYLWERQLVSPDATLLVWLSLQDQFHFK